MKTALRLFREYIKETPKKKRVKDLEKYTSKNNCGITLEQFCDHIKKETNK